jgi:hypothetical protein
MDLSDGYLIVVKEDCPTCVEIVPAFDELIAAGVPVTIASQDDPAFPRGMAVLDDSALELSWRLDVEVTPTVIEVVDGETGRRIVGWHRDEWEAFFGIEGLAPALPDWRPGCGSVTREPGMPERLAARYDGAASLASRRVSLGDLEDEHEALIARGWSDGLPVVPPTPERVLRMLAGTGRDPADVVAVLAPDYREATVEKVAVNAVMAGCRPEYLPVVLTAVEAAARDEFDLHGVAATTWFSGPVVIVNGPVAERIGMNSGLNLFGPGNRANATIGRALNLVIRNIGGSRPGGVDRSTMGHPAKYTMAFAEREHDSPWPSLASERGIPDGRSAVTLFAGQGPAPVSDQLSREPESLARSLAASLRVVHHVKLGGRLAAVVAISPEHARTFAGAGWSKERLRDALLELLTVPAEELMRESGGMTVGLSNAKPGEFLTKFTPDNLWFVHVGSTAGGSSGIISGWMTGAGGSQMVTLPIEED